MDEVASLAVRTESLRVECPAKLRLVLGVSAERSQLGHAVRELALLAVLARAVLFERATQFRLVAGRVGLSQPGRSGFVSFSKRQWDTLQDRTKYSNTMKTLLIVCREKKNTTQPLPNSGRTKQISA